MKGNAKLIEELNGLLANELAAINQYVVHAEMSENWGYGKLGKLASERSRTEMKHAEKLIERILFLEGRPIVSNLTGINIGADVNQQLVNDHAAELTAIGHYNATIKTAQDAGDNATKEILDGILADEDAHIDAIEEKIDQIQQMGIQNFLSIQV